MRKIVLLVLLALFSNGCCVSKITLMSQLDVANVGPALVSTIKPTVTFEFKDCVPSKEQKKLAQKIRVNIANAFDNMIRDGATVEDQERYNRIAKVGINALKSVLYTHQARTDKKINLDRVAKATGMTLPRGVTSLTRDQKLKILEMQAMRSLRAAAAMKE